MNTDRTRQAVIKGPHSKRFDRGIISQAVDETSPQGQFIRKLEADLIEHIGGAPSVTEWLLIQRIIRLQVRLDLFDRKLATKPETWTPHDDWTYHGCGNAFRLALRELGFKPRPKPAPSFEDYMREQTEAAE
jgi:hypothetical protein